MNPSSPPPDSVNASIVHKVCEFYKKLYSFRSKVHKRDYFGIYVKLENSSLEIIRLCIQAALEPRTIKLASLTQLRIEVEISKRLTTIMHDLGIINMGNYIIFQSDLQEISKMTNGWINYLKNKAPNN